MSENKRPVLYPPQRAIEHIQTMPGQTLVRLFAIFFPLWLVEASGTQEDARPYELMEHYIERGIGEGQLHTAGSLADFFCLDIKLVEKILLFLQTIGHVACTEGRWHLTQLGEKSRLAGKKFVRQEKRLKFYFDGFHSRPLLQEHYNGIRPLAKEEIEEGARIYRGGARFHQLISFRSWHPAALSILEKQNDRARYNLPEEAHDIKVLEEPVLTYMPMYIIETKTQVAQSTASKYIAYTHVKGRYDQFFSSLVNEYQEVKSLLQAEKELRADALWSAWLATKGLAHIQPMQLANGVWQVILAPDVFSSQQKGFSLTDIGSYQLEKGYFLRLWCDDVSLRRDAALDHALKVIKGKKRGITKQELNEHLKLLSEQLHTRQLELKDVRQRAVDKEMMELVDILDTF